jgi:hypothetical protein
MANSLMDNAVLLSVSFHRFGTKKTVGSDEVETDADRKMIHVCKDLFESDRYDDIVTHDGKTSKYIKRLTSGAPFLRAGVSMLGVSLVTDVDSYLKERASERRGLVGLFLDQLPLCKASAQTRLGSLFNSADYPSAEKVEGAFWVDWSFLEFHTPGKLRGINPEIWAAQKAKLESAVQSAADECMIMLRAEAAGVFGKMIERLSPDDSGKRKKFHDTLTENVHQFLDTFKDRNITNDQELARLVEDVRAVMKGVDASHLRDSDSLRVKVSGQVGAIMGKLDGMLVDRPKRRINLQDVAAVEDATGAAA